ncbi:hypothetical protein AX17_005771 [Amanita inopinata Kibby_2008]|nr:hypothetical protein AX17_005771 [Amanita inopinata Kibby_2008]
MLSYSQVDRLLRPLRSKCNALATFSRRSTHTSQPATDDASTAPPLLILLPPDTVGLRVRLNKHSVSTLELSRKIYAVRDSFRDVVVKILKRNNSNPSSPLTQGRVFGLADFCATIVGSRLLSELNQSQDIEEGDTAVEIFDSIPIHYRRKAVIAYSLALILQICPHHPTLLMLLLDMTLTYRLMNESCILLQALLVIACCSDTPAPICHPAHKTFLVDLYKQWLSSSSTASDFVHILSDVLQTADSTAIWTCKASMAFVSELIKDDLTSFMSFVHELLRGLSDLAPSTDQASAGREKYQCLHELLNIASASLLSHGQLDYGYFIPSLLDRMTFLAQANFSSIGDLPAELTNILTCLATYWLSTAHHDYTQYQVMHVVATLEKFKPKPTAYNLLMTKMLESCELPTFRTTLQSYTATLQSHSLLRLEASLWACALRHVESPEAEQMLSAGGTVDVVREFRVQLIHQVEEAERRCFGNQQAPRHHDPSNRHRRRRSSGGNGEWIWDPTFECWFRSHDHESTLKKQRVQHHQKLPTRFSCPNSFRSSPDQRSLSVCLPLRNSVQSPTREDPDNDNPLVHVPISRKNFATLLCQAASNRFVLHPEKQTCHDRSSSPEWMTGQMTLPDLESDDALNLFSYQ